MEKIEKQGESQMVIKHMEKFNKKLNQLEERGFIPKGRYKEFKKDVSNLIKMLVI